MKFAIYKMISNFVLSAIREIRNNLIINLLYSILFFFACFLFDLRRRLAWILRKQKDSVLTVTMLYIFNYLSLSFGICWTDMSIMLSRNIFFLENATWRSFLNIDFLSSFLCTYPILKFNISSALLLKS